MYAAIVFLPLLGFLLAGPFGWRIGPRPSEIVTTGLLFVSALLSWIVFFQVALGTAPATVSVIGNWFTSGALQADWSLRIDTLTAVMLVVVTTVSSVVHLYSIGYMHDDRSRPRFFAFLSLFTFAMLTLVTANNLVQLFFGWEGVGLLSYLLIGFWYEKPSANAAAIKAFVVNRVGDFGFLLGIFLVFTLTNSVGFDQIFAAAPGLANKTVHVFGLDLDAMTIACLLLFMGAMGKSAQFLLHTWLPDAMEGPTPVSALIHAATMVTAGVFMVARLSPLFEQAPAALSFVTIIGATTAFFAATIALVQPDIKKVIAYSTCSQLGYMFTGLGVGGYPLGIFHLFTHAFFKGLLFLCAGSVIIAMHHEQDMRNMGGLWRKVPFTFAMMTIGFLSLMGFPFTAGYYSKDAIIEAAFASDRAGAFYGYVLTAAAAGLTAFYSWRVVFLTFFGAPRWEAAGRGAGHDHAAHSQEGHALDPHESPLTMLIPLGVLALGALFAGVVFSHDFIGKGWEGFWKEALYLGPNNHILKAREDIPGYARQLPTLIMAFGSLVAVLFYVLAPSIPPRLAQIARPLYELLLNKWYFDEFYDMVFVQPAFWLGRLFWKGGDGAIIDRLGPDGVAARVVDMTRRVVKLQSGYIYHYAFAMLIGLAAGITWYVASGVR
ncbi:MAG: NADH-quinone oxidoreductase subunit L [Methylocella sp.]